MGTNESSFCYVDSGNPITQCEINKIEARLRVIEQCLHGTMECSTREEYNKLSEEKKMLERIKNDYYISQTV
jgi:hypothetical protein